MADNLADILVELQRRLFEVERRLANHRRTGVIDEIDHGKGVARVKIEGGEQPFRTGWIPWKEIAAGGISTHIPPTVGQQVDVMSESGDLTDAVIDFSTHSNANPRPHDGPDAVIVKGGVRFSSAMILSRLMRQTSLLLPPTEISPDATDRSSR